MLESRHSLSKSLKRHRSKQTIRRKRTPGKHKKPDGYEIFYERLKELGFQTYDEYLRSDVWHSFNAWYRSSTYPKQCLVCGSRQFVLHHWTYLRLGYEDLQDVIPLCADHHTELHRYLENNDVKIDALKQQFVGCFGFTETKALRTGRKITSRFCYSNASQGAV